MPRWPGRTTKPNLKSGPDEERVERVRAVEQRVVLQPDLPAVVEEGLEVLVVVVLDVLRAEQALDDLGIGSTRRFHAREVREALETARDVAGRERLALE